MKKITSIVISLAMLLTLFLQASAFTTKGAANSLAFGKYSPAITVSIVHSTIDSDVVYPKGETATNNVWTKLYKDKLGINLDVKWAGPSEQSPQKINLIIASGDLPNIMSCDGNTVQQLAKAGKLLDLKSVFDKYATTDIKTQLYSDGGRAMQSATINGKLYAIPTFLNPQEDAFILWVREDWRKKLHLPEPKTMNDMLKIADAFTTQDPDGDGKNDTPGLGMTSDLWAHLSPFMNAYGVYPGYSQLMDYPHQWVKDKSGKLVVGMENPGVKTALAKLQGLYKNGDIDKEYALLNYDTMPQKIADGKMGMVYGPWWYPGWPLQMSVDKDPKADWKGYPMPSAIGKPSATMAIAGLALRRYNVVTTSMKHPEAAIKLANMTYEKIYGATAEPLKYQNNTIDPKLGAAMWKYSAMYVNQPAENINKFTAINNALSTYNTSKLNPSAKSLYDNVVKFNNGDMSQWYANKDYGFGGSFGILKYYADNNYYHYDEFTGAPTKTMVTKGPIIMKKLYEVTNKIIMGADLSEWDKFMTYWHQNGGDQITKEVNDWYKVQK